MGRDSAKSDEIKIVALPRGNEKKSQQSAPEPQVTKKPSRMIIYVGAVSALFLGLMIYLPGPTRSTDVPQAASKAGQMALNSVSPMARDPVNKHLRDAQIQQDMMIHKTQMENQQLRVEEMSDEASSSMSMPDAAAINGVQLDSEDVSQKVFEDLDNEDSPDRDVSPADRISARLANYRWINQLQRRERVAFLRNFIRAAHDKGYDLEINGNLEVVGVTAVRDSKVSIEQIMDRIEKQGF